MAPPLKTIAFGFRPELCVGCGRCIIACLDAHDTPIGTVPPLRVSGRVESEDAGQADIEYYTAACFHCEAAPCAAVCPKGCVRLDDVVPLVVLDNEFCIGCGNCARVCRYDAVRFRGGRAFKCDGCAERVRRGQKPVCAAVCSQGAITLDDRNEVLRTGRQWIAAAIKS
ncbi:MAG: 4Fe-4S dicluster domain-containing protein [Peptococcaceae bacterium]|nr:4Fe-4S dicluster domain-containing protein [Peptococcaceae bacterium]